MKRNALIPCSTSHGNSMFYISSRLWIPISRLNETNACKRYRTSSSGSNKSLAIHFVAAGFKSVYFFSNLLTLSVVNGADPEAVSDVREKPKQDRNQTAQFCHVISILIHSTVLTLIYSKPTSRE
eukprot:IDg13193t1